MKQRPDEVLAAALKDLIPKARRILAIDDARGTLKTKAANILAQRDLTAATVEASRAHFMETLELEDLEACVQLQIHAQAVETLIERSQYLIVRTDYVDRLWTNQYGNETGPLANEFVTECHRRLTRLLNESEASDARLAASVELEPSDSAQTKYLREKLRGTPETGSWQSATSAARTLFT